MRLGIEKTAMIRLRAGISYALTEAMDEGHCGLPTDQLIPLAEELLEAPKDLILTALELERSEGAVIADKVGDTACTFLAGLYRAEQAIADRLIRIVNGGLPWTWIDEEKAVPWVEKRSGLQLAESQRAAIRLALTAKALVITGGPGVGKTTIVNSILKILAAKNVRLLLCAPTGRAAKRMTEATGVEAKTIHRLLEIDPRAAGSRATPTIPSIAIGALAPLNHLGPGELIVEETSLVLVRVGHDRQFSHEVFHIRQDRQEPWSVLEIGGPNPVDLDGLRVDWPIRVDPGAPRLALAPALAFAQHFDETDFDDDASRPSGRKAACE